MRWFDEPEISEAAARRELLRRSLNDAPAEMGNRVGFADRKRLSLACLGSFLVGVGLGTMQGSKMAGLRFRAEHAHRLPTSIKGWYYYHKSKSYVSAVSGLKEGVRMGAKVSIITTAVTGLEAMFDHQRGTRDAINSTTACVAVAGAFSVYNRYSLAMAARTTKTALIVGLIYGGLQDVMGALSERHVGWIDYLKEKVGKCKNSEGGGV